MVRPSHRSDDHIVLQYKISNFVIPTPLTHKTPHQMSNDTRHGSCTELLLRFQVAGYNIELIGGKLMS